MAVVVGIVSSCDLRIETHHRKQPNKTKVAHKNNTIIRKFKKYDKYMLLCGP